MSVHIDLSTPVHIDLSTPVHVDLSSSTTALPHEHPCKKVFDTYLVKRSDMLKKKIESAIAECKDDIKRSAEALIDLDEIVVYRCSWVEDYGNEYESRSTICNSYFLHEYQALSFTSAKRHGCTLQKVTVCHNKRNYKYYIFEGTDGIEQNQIYVELTEEDKRIENEQRRIASLQYELNSLKNGRGGW
jgi:hypothetical protein